jgi:hypothetical protein
MVQRGGGSAGDAAGTVAAGRAETFGAVPNNFPEPPLKRLYPWSRDNRFGTDIIAGKVDEKGAFKGMVIQDAQLHVLQRYLALARSHLPETLPLEVQAMNDGYPTIVVTRGVYGRELDVHDGPLRNTAQEAIWETVRKARSDNPRMRIKCVDVPATATTAEIAKCLEPPLDAYQELAYYDGVWYSPDVQTASKAVKAAKEFPRKTLYQSARAKMSGKQTPSAQVAFNRKSFAWVKDELEDQLWELVWKPVFTDTPNVPPPVDPERLVVNVNA